MSSRSVTLYFDAIQPEFVSGSHSGCLLPEGDRINAVSSAPDTALTLQALRVAISERKPGPGILSTTLTRGCNMLPANTWMSSRDIALKSAWRGQATPTRTP